MTNRDFDSAELTKEKSLWDVYIASRRIPFSKFNFWSTLLVLWALALHSLISLQPLHETLLIVRELSSDGLVMALGTLGFLLAGFTIFATITQPELSLAMASMTHRDSGLTYLKHTYFLFLRVFIYYLVFAGLCLFILIFGHESGLVDTLVSMSPHAGHLKFVLVRGTYILLFGGYFFLIVQLKSFIFNIYHSVMTSLRWHAEREE